MKKYYIDMGWYNGTTGWSAYPTQEEAVANYLEGNATETEAYILSGEADGVRVWNVNGIVGTRISIEDLQSDFEDWWDSSWDDNAYSLIK